jgi:hypothetical protein
LGKSRETCEKGRLTGLPAERWRLDLGALGRQLALQMNLTILKYLSLGGLLALGLGACGPSAPAGSEYMAGVGGPVQRPTSGGPFHPPPAIPDDISYWDGDGATGSPLIKINRAQQKAFFYKGAVLVGVSRISSGSEDHGTPAGSYKITQKSKNHKSSIYGVFKDKASGQTINDKVDIRVDKVPPGAVFYNAPMPNFLRFNGAIGMHTGFLPGYPASAGCIRLPHHMAEKFFDNVEIGTPVIVE